MNGLKCAKSILRGSPFNSRVLKVQMSVKNSQVSDLFKYLHSGMPIVTAVNIFSASKYRFYNTVNENERERERELPTRKATALEAVIILMT